ncbi:hypothetical protein [Leptolyngbya sp. FACHB-321]|uniref:hypothetical protein n=1 Tax=Leptolyngbya sp. FACHB-321 TaxID=2692807 RepID=UPI0018EFD034|nr:hypothetical protein [Leptolyngbya sp. FACHB-321]
MSDSYLADFDAWITQTTQLLREHRWHEIDDKSGTIRRQGTMSISALQTNCSVRLPDYQELAHSLLKICIVLHCVIPSLNAITNIIAEVIDLQLKP